MRPIKFRAWSISGGYFVQPDSMHGDVDDRPFRFQDLEKILNADGYVFQQFTGLLDKNGKEIYEGDIVCGGIYGTEVFAIQFDDDIDTDGNGITSGWSIGFTVPEVIGNIYENSELLK